MSKRNKISLGTPTEELPEWTLSLDFTESQDTIKEEKKQPERTVSSESTFSNPAPQPVQSSGSGLSSGLSGGLNTEFVIGNDNAVSGDDSFSQPLPSQNNSASENVLDFGADALPPQNAESITTLDFSDDTEKADSITTIEQPVVAPVPEPQPEPVVEAVAEPIPESQPEPVIEAVTEPAPESQPEPVVEAVVEPAPESQPEPVVEAVVEPVPEPQPEPVVEAVVEPAPEPQPEPVVEAVVEPVPEPQPEPVVEAVVEPVPEPQPEPHVETVAEPVDVDSQLSNMANSIVSEENEEQLLSAAADLIKNEQNSEQTEDIEIIDEMDHSTPENNDDVLALLKQLDVSENIERMQTATQEDIADVIEQTEAEHELEAAVPVEESISVSDLQPAVEEPVQQDTPVTEEVPMESLDSLMPEEPTESVDISDLQPVVEEPVQQDTPVTEEVPMESLDSLMPEEPMENKEEPVMEITNDMFDMGYDLEDEPQYSEENIDLSAFQGSIKDAEEINKPASDALDLDAAEAGSASSLDMSNLVAAAMNTLTHHREENEFLAKDETPAIEQEAAIDIASDETAPEAIQPDPSKLEKATLDFSENDDESPEANLDFGEEEDETLSNLDFVVEEEPEDTNLDFNSDFDFDPDANLDFTEEEEENPEFNLDYKEDEDPFAEAASEPEITTETSFEPETEPVPQPESKPEPETQLEPDLKFESDLEPDLKFESETEPDLKFEYELEPELKEKSESEAEPPLEFQSEPQLEPDIADYQFEAEPEPALDFEADLDADRAIENLIPPMDDTLSHQLDEVMTESQGSIAAPSVDETTVESPLNSTETTEENAETQNAPVSPDTELETPEPAQEEVPFTLHFEPVNPDQGSSFAEEMNDFDDVSSLIIEDYNEVPTVSSLEKDLKKQEKEKKKNRKKNAKKKKDEGFSLSLDEMGEKQAGDAEEEEKEKFKYSSSMPIRSTNMPKVSKPKEEPAKEPEQEKFKYSSSMPIRSTNMPEVPKPKEEPAKTETREPASQPASTSGSTEDVTKIQAVTPEMLAEERKEVEHLGDVHTHHEEKIYAEKNIYDNGTFQREYYQLYYQ